jgi:hypothetical protein
MASYQIYSIDAEGRVTGNRTIEASNDAEAVFAVRSMQRQLVTEIWRRDQRVARVPGVPQLSEQRVEER